MPDDAEFTPNPDRAIWIQGRMCEEQLERLRPEILELTHQSRDPITIFIDSGGGSDEVGRGLLRLLRRTTEDDARASRIITVAAPRAASSAANLLSAGDFAIAYPESRLLYHGGRWPLPVEELTGEWARIGRVLATFHEMAATALAQASLGRFFFVVSAERTLFSQHRAEMSDPTLTDLSCFQAILRGKLSPAALVVLERAIPLADSYNGLFLHFRKRLRRGRTVTKEHLQKLMLHASIAFEYETSKGAPAWDGGLVRICDHFYFLNSYFDFGELSEWVAGRREAPQTADMDVDADNFLQFRVFFLALCRALQEGENNITASDAVWLGLIDTVRAARAPQS